MKKRTDEEIRLQEEIATEIAKLSQTIRQMPREKSAYLIIRRFLMCEDPSDELRDEFHRWLVSPRNAQAKETALQRCFEEMCGSDTDRSFDERNN